MKIKFPISFTKMSGTGNDFIIIDHRQRFLAGLDPAAFARSICRRKFSVGADGLILIENSATADFGWQFFNADGSRAEMCGNGARCAARFAYSNNIAPAVMTFETMAGLIEARIGARPESVMIRLTPPTGAKLKQKIILAGQEKELHFINTGVPHVVLLEDDLQAVPVVDWGRFIRFHENFQPAGTNVNFVQLLSPQALQVRTYERGVEDETMACGTGAVAAALIAALLGRVKSPVAVTTSGGEQLVIHFSGPAAGEISGPEFRTVDLEGPVHLVYEGHLGAETVNCIPLP